MQETIVVIGGGLVGLCCAIFLRREGYSVTLIDRRSPGRENSFGSAGILSRADIQPVFSTHFLKDMPASLSSGAVKLDLKSLPKLAPWALKAIAKGHIPQKKKMHQALDALQRFGLPLHLELARAAGVSHLIQQQGILKGYRSRKTYQDAAHQWHLMQEFGISFQVLTKNELHDLEPAIRDIYEQVIWMADAGFILDPGNLCDAYSRLFIQMGGDIKRAHVTSLQPTDGRINIYTQEQAEKPFEAQQIVLTLGPWSLDLIGSLGYQFPITYGRGYHQNFVHTPDQRLGRPLEDVAGRFILSPMKDGVRLTTGITLGDLGHRPDPDILNQASQQAKKIMSLGPPLASRLWHGDRPILPDSLPVIGRAHKHNRLWFAFGHQQIGVSSAAITGKLISEMLAHRQTSLDVTPYAPVRFSR